MKKTCSSCKNEKGIDEFSLLRKSKDGHQSVCKKCAVEKTKCWSERNKRNGPSVTVKVKVCYVCKEQKVAVSEFGINRCTKDGFNAACKRCACELVKNYRPQNVIVVSEKTCSRCAVEKPISQFSKHKQSKDGHVAYCKDCQHKMGLKHRAKLKKNGPTIRRDRKVCTTCRTEKSISSFHKKVTSTDGYRSECKECNLGNETLKVRKHVLTAIKRYAGAKTKPAIAYGIDITRIVQAIGPRPSKNHHLDHKLPLSAFDYSQEWQIAASWHERNLQWLLAEENLKKNDSHDPEELKEYLDWYRTEHQIV